VHQRYCAFAVLRLRRSTKDRNHIRIFCVVLAIRDEFIRDFFALYRRCVHFQLSVKRRASSLHVMLNSSLHFDLQRRLHASLGSVQCVQNLLLQVAFQMSSHDSFLL